MAWTKIPAENHPLFHAAVPRDPRVTVVKMFGGVACLVNGNMFGGLFARSVVVKLSAEDQAVALALDGTVPFDPMGTGRVMKDTLLLPEEVLNDPEDLRRWLRRALDYTATLPGKKKAKSKGLEGGGKPAREPARTKAAAKNRSTGRRSAAR